jgi:hypothetical protein
MGITLPSFSVNGDLMSFGNSLIFWLWPVFLVVFALVFGPEIVSALVSAWRRVTGSAAGRDSDDWELVGIDTFEKSWDSWEGWD